MKRRVLLVDDEVAVLLTLKAVLEISGFDVDTATSAREGKARIRHREYEMVITDMRMEDERAGEEVIAEARLASYKPAVALLTAFPVGDAAWQDMGADKMLVKPMHTRALLQQLESLFEKREQELGPQSKLPVAASSTAAKKSAAKKPVKKAAVKKTAPKKVAPKKTAKKAVVKKIAAKKSVAKKTATKSSAKKAVKSAPAKKTTASKKTTAAKKPATKKAAKKSAIKKPVKKSAAKKRR